MAGFSRGMHGQDAGRRVRTRAAVLDALLSFHPETALTGEDLVVVPPTAAGVAGASHGAGDAAATSGRWSIAAW